MKPAENPRPEYFFTAFDRATDLWTWEAIIPDAKFSQVWVAAAIPVSPGDFVECWPLQPSQAAEVARVLECGIEESEARYFIEVRQPEAESSPHEHLTFDVTGAPETGWRLARIGGIALGSVMIMTAPFLAGGLLIDLYDRPFAGAAIIIAGLVICAWRYLLTPYRAAMKVRAYGLALPEIRSALAPFRASAAKFRSGWLLLNLAAAMAALASLRFGGDLYHVISVGVAGLLVLNGFRLFSDQGGVRKTAASYVLLALIWFGAFAVLAFGVENFEEKDGGLIGGVFLVVFWIAVSLTNRVWTIGRASLEDMRRRDRRRPVLFLRSFEDDDKIDGILKNVLRQYGPFIGIGKPGELRPDGAARTYFSGEAWRPAVVEMMNDAAVLVVVLGLTPGLDWELQQVANGPLLSKAIFVSFVGDHHIRLDRLHRRLDDTPEGDQLKLLDLSDARVVHIGEGLNWVTIRSQFDSLGEVQASLEVALYGVLVDREREPHGIV